MAPLVGAYAPSKRSSLYLNHQKFLSFIVILKVHYRTIEYGHPSIRMDYVEQRNLTLRAQF